MGYTDILKIFLENYSIDINKKYKYGQTLLHIVSTNCDIDCFRLLLEIDNINETDDNGYTPFYYFCYNYDKKQDQSHHDMMMIYLEDMRIDINRSFLNYHHWCEYTVLENACRYGDSPLVEILCSNRSDIILPQHGYEEYIDKILNEYR